MPTPSRETIVEQIPIHQLREAAVGRMDPDTLIQIRENYNRAIAQVFQEADNRGGWTTIKGVVIGALTGIGVGGAIHLLGDSAKEYAKDSSLIMVGLMTFGGALIGGIAGSMRASFNKIQFVDEHFAPLETSHRWLLAESFTDNELKLLLLQGWVQGPPR